MTQGADDAAVVLVALVADPQPVRPQTVKGAAVAQQDVVETLQPFPQRQQGGFAANQQEVGGRRQGADARQLGQLLLEPGPFTGRPALHPAA